MMRMLRMEYVGAKYPGGVTQDFEHEKFYFGPENNWQCEVPTILAGQLIQEFGTDKFMPALPDMSNIEELQNKITALAEENKKLSAKVKALEEEAERSGQLNKPLRKTRKKK